MTRTRSLPFRIRIALAYQQHPHRCRWMSPTKCTVCREKLCTTAAAPCHATPSRAKPVWGMRVMRDCSALPSPAPPDPWVAAGRGGAPERHRWAPSAASTTEDSYSAVRGLGEGAESALRAAGICRCEALCALRRVLVWPEDGMRAAGSAGNSSPPTGAALGSGSAAPPVATAVQGCMHPCTPGTCWLGDVSG